MDPSVGVILNGVRDTIDYYAMALLAGQAPTVQLSSLENDGVGASITVFDPDGRLIDSDASIRATPQVLAGHPFTIKVDRPGVYRFAVSCNADYELRITNVADIALGAVAAGVNIFTHNRSTFTTSLPFEVHQGDLGALTAGGFIIDGTSEGISTLEDPSVLPITVDRGNLRSIEAPDIGILTIVGTTRTYSNWENINVPRGSVGLVRATDATPTGSLLFNLALVPVNSSGAPNGDLAIGGDYQLVSAANDFSAYLLADRGIGTIRAAQMISPIAPYFVANADQPRQRWRHRPGRCHGGYGHPGRRSSFLHRPWWKCPLRSCRWDRI